MTKLNRPVKRETETILRKRPLIIQIEPPGIIRIKEKGTRTWFETSVEAVYSMAVKQHIRKMYHPIARHMKNSYKAFLESIK